MLVGDVVANRFAIERPLGSGGMGSVFVATDRAEGRSVAIKVLDLVSEGAVERFRREARTLAELSHPGVVRYIAHGETAERQPFLAMELLAGEDLATRLARTGLSPDESVALIRRVAEALACAHANGIVHRDIKPSNLFLVDGNVERVKVLDFGIARAISHTAGLTQTGAMLGTVGYMAPEQAMGSREVDARADVFALGCVFFECLAGRPAFAGEHVVAILAKVLTEEAPRIGELRPGLASAIDPLVATMLAKSPEDRPADASAVVAALDGLSALTGGDRSERPRSSAALTRSEQRVVSVILAEPVMDLVSSATITPDQSSEDIERLRSAAARFSAELTPLQGGAMLFLLSGKDAPSDQTSRAAACALEVHRLRPDLRLALATGRAETTGRLPVGPAIDRAAALLRSAGSNGAATILVDDVTAGLLGERVETRVEADALVLIGLRLEVEPPRTLLGKPTPCVGRDKELGLLRATLSECIDESVARAVLVTGPPGQGKSRLRHELLSAAREQGDVAILTARADPANAGSSFTLVRQIVRQAMNLREGESEHEQRQKLRARVADVCRGADFSRIADFLGELVGIPSADSRSPELRSARNDPQVMGGWIERSFQEWLAAECASRAHVVVLEDLHWGDLPSVTYLGDALRLLAAKPFMVLAFARPEVHETFPNLWAFAEKNELSLGRLPPRAAERLVRAVLGEGVAVDTVGRIVERADGNAFYLEELIRRVAEGEADTLPETVLTLVQSRLERLEPEARRVMRAASVFGGVFWRGGVTSLLGAPSTPSDIDGWLTMLAQRELITSVRGSRFHGDQEFAFRHDLVRDAAYSMLTEADRTMGHRLAGEWLDASGEKDALMLADHFQKGGDPKRAIPWLVDAAQAAVDGGSFHAALALCTRGLACEPEPRERSRIAAAQQIAFGMLGEPRAAADASVRTMGFAEVGSTMWFVGAAGAFFWGTFVGDSGITTGILQEIFAIQTQPAPSGPYGSAVHATCAALGVVGEIDLARSFLERAQALDERATDPDLAFRSHVYTAKAFLDLIDGQMGTALEGSIAAQELADRAGHVVAGLLARLNVLNTLFFTGNVERVEAVHSELLSSMGGRSFSGLSDWAEFHLGAAKLVAGRPHEAIEMFSALVGRRDWILATSARASLAIGLVATGDLAGGEREATACMSAVSGLPPIVHCLLLQTLALVELWRGEAAKALATSDRGLSARPRRGGVFFADVGLLLTRAEALRALNRDDDARAAIREVRDHVLRVAATLDKHPDLRESFLTRVVGNARTMQLAKEWLEG